MIKEKLRLSIIAIFLTVIICGVLVYRDPLTFLLNYGNSKSTLSSIGSRGQEVINIQSRLKSWGYYNGDIDGIYGYQTYQAVRLFQQKNGLTVDGIAGPETLAAIGLPTGTTGQYAPTAASNNKDVDLLARLIHGEGRGEPYVGQVAIGAVVLNRTRDSRFPSSIAGVIYQPGAFDVVTDGQINLAPDTSSINAAKDALNGWDPTNGCIYYWNPATATSRWIWSRPIVTQIGNHVFAR